MRRRALVGAAGIMSGTLVGQFFGGSRGVAEAAAPSGSDLDRIVKAGVVRIGNDLTIKGKAFMDPSTHQASGFEVEIGNEMARQMHVKPEWVQIPFDGLIPALRAGRIDLIHTGMFRRAERALVVEFTNPLYRVGMLFVVRKDETRVRTIEDANQPGFTIGAETGTGEAAYVPQYLPKAKLLTFQTAQETALALKTKQIDAWFDDDYFLGIYAKDNPDVKLVGPSVNVTASGIAVRRGSDLLPWLNQFTWDIKATGWLKQLLQKWGVPESLDSPWDPHLFPKINQ